MVSLIKGIAVQSKFRVIKGKDHLPISQVVQEVLIGLLEVSPQNSLFLEFEGNDFPVTT